LCEMNLGASPLIRDERQVEGRFYAENEFIEDQVSLTNEEGAHAVRSKRLRQGSLVEVFNGKGLTRRGVLKVSGAKKIFISFTEPVKIDEAPAQLLAMVVSPAKGDRMTFLVEKLSELGADRLIPAVFRRSLDAGGRACTSKTPKWRRTTVESAKQCGRSRLLEICDPLKPDQIIRTFVDYDIVVLLTTERESSPFQKVLSGFSSPPKNSLIIVGPEGGFTPEEIDYIMENGAASASLGKGILRIETAALAAAAVFRSVWP